MCLFPLNPQRENQLGKQDDKWQQTLVSGVGENLGHGGGCNKEDREWGVGPGRPGFWLFTHVFT